MPPSHARSPSSAAEWTVEDAVEQTKSALMEAAQWGCSKALLFWALTTRRMRAVGGIFIFILIVFSLYRPDQYKYEVPKVSLDYSNGKPMSPYNASKVALLIENRPNPVLAPLMLHFMSVVPPDWRFRFMGSIESVASINSSYAIRNQVAIGRLDLTYIPANMSTADKEHISRFLTNLWLYEQVLRPAEWLLLFQTDSVLCANSRQSLNDWLDYDWVGAPWSPESRFGGNGGLSLRRVSAIVEVLKNQYRPDESRAEDVFLSDLLGHRPGGKLANGTISMEFSAENQVGKPTVVDHKKAKGKHRPEKKPAGGGIDSVPQDEGWDDGVEDWREGFYEPMGYHTGDAGTHVPGGIWGTPALRKHIWDYCPEIKMTLRMDAAEYMPGECHQTWKRGEIEVDEFGEPVWDRELEVDEDGYPPLPPGLRPW